MKYYIYILFVLLVSLSYAQSAQLKGIVYGYDINQNKTPLFGAVVTWDGTNIGAKTNNKGEFTLNKSPETDILIVSYSGYLPLRQSIKSDVAKIDIQLELNTSEAVTVYGKQSALILSESAIKTQEITLSGLRKAACCNLSESFTANASVDVNFSDAVTGAKRIELLGLQGIYTQMMTENIPNLRGLSTTYGLNYVPGQWMESIQISKGAASVTAGYESITGQINVEYKKPRDSDKLFVNLYSSFNGMLEADAITALKISDKLHTNLMLHINYFGKELDNNEDTFLDHPLETQYAAMNKWEYKNNGLHTMHTIKVLKETRKSGQIDYYPNEDKNKYGIKIQSERYELFGKVGYVFPTEAYHSLAFMYALSSHNQNSFYGLKKYDGNQKSAFGKIIYETQFGHKKDDCTDCEEKHNHESHSEGEHIYSANKDSVSTAAESDEFEDYDEATEAEEANQSEEDDHIHKINMGISFNYDDFDEDYSNFLANAKNLRDTTMKKIERVPGILMEYTYTGIDNLAVIAGLRYDFHNIYGNLFTPRLHIKYRPYEELTLRASAGKGYHLPNVFAENSGIFISSRDIFINEKLQAEEAWNYGISGTFIIELFDNKFTVNADYYRTDFKNQTIIDYEKQPGEVHFYNLHGKSYSNAYQIDVNFLPTKNIDILAAYRYNDVKMTVNGSIIEKPLVSRFKTFLNIAYSTDEGSWKFDITGVLNGGGSLPDTELNPPQYRLAKEFKPYFTLQSQITYRISDLEIYLGGENLTNYTQSNPIIAYDSPFGEYFDGSMIWGPVMGRKVYAGLRYKLN